MSDKKPKPYFGYYLIHEAAGVLGIRPRSVYRLIQKGRLETRKRFGMNVIPVSSLETLLENGYKIKENSTLLSKVSCAPAVGAFIDSLSDEKTMKRVVDECSSEAVRMIEEMQ